MPDGALFERGGEFVETGYDDMLRRAAEYGLELIPQGFEFAAREVRFGGEVLPGLLLAAERAVAETVAGLGAHASDISAAEALAQTALDRVARRALECRLEGTFTVRLDDVAAAWLAKDELRAGGASTLPSSRLAAGNDALAKAMARELGDRVRLGRPVGALRLTGDGVTLVVAGERARLRARGARRPAARRPLRPPARARRARELHAPAVGHGRQAARAAGGAGGARRGSGPGGRVLDLDGERRGRWPGDRRLVVRGRVAPPTRRSRSSSPAGAGSPSCGSSGPSSFRAARPCSRPGGRSAGTRARTPAIRPAGRARTTPSQPRRTAACILPASTPRERSAARWRVRCAAVPALRPRSSPPRAHDRPLTDV